MEKKKKLVLETLEEIRTVTDPYRFDIIQIFRKNSNKPMNVKEVASKMGEAHGKVYYHIKKLEKVGALKIDHTESKNGIIAKYYVLDFSEIDIQRKHTNDENENDDVEINQTINVVSKLYDESKNAFIGFIRKSKEIDKKDLKDGEKSNHLMNSTLYFTASKYQKFIEEIEELMEKYAEETGDKDEYKKSALISIHSELEDIE